MHASKQGAALCQGVSACLCQGVRLYESDGASVRRYRHLKTSLFLPGLKSQHGPLENETMRQRWRILAINLPLTEAYILK
jgi:hypothetical protein